MRLALVTNIPAPYRVPVYALAGRATDIDLTLVYLAAREPDREWDLPSEDFDAIYLDQRLIAWRGRYIHFTRGVTRALRQLDPDVVITTGFNPAHLAAFAYALRHGKPHVPMTDGTLHSEQGLSAPHRLVRRFVYRRSAAFIGASRGSFELYRSYGVPESSLFQSHLCCDLERYAQAPEAPKRFDLVFSGRLVAVKSPGFVLQVAARAAALLGRRVSVLFLGSGPLLAEVQAESQRLSASVACTLFGHASQAELPALYRSAQVCVFPSQGEPWGVVANEACAAGLPVLTTPYAGVAGEIVCDGDNGYVLPLDVESWAVHAARLLGDAALRERMGHRSRQIVQPYNFGNAANGIVAAARHALA